jgi:agmatine deiminase
MNGCCCFAGLAAVTLRFRGAADWRQLVSSPREQGFVMPPEWAPHERCWMAWPCRAEHWGERLAAARQAHAEVAKAIAGFEPVTMIARPDLAAEASVQCGQGIPVLPLDYDDSWIRDTAPTFVRNAEGLLAGIDWPFNGYGERSPEYAQDAALAEKICRRLKLPRFAGPIVLEGGAVHVDGEGTALVCAESVLDPRRNPGLDRSEAETTLRDYLGVETVIWLAQGLVDDASGGHVDNLACFAGPGRVLALAGGEADDPNRPILEDNLARLRAARDAKGRELEVIEIQQPAARHREDGRRLTASYINFYLANGAIIVPIFGDPADAAAFHAIQAAFPDRQIVEVEAADLIYGGGGIHCITQQQPKSGAD